MDYMGNAYKLAKAISEFTDDSYTLRVNKDKTMLSLSLNGVHQAGPLGPDNMCYLLGGILLGHGYSLEKSWKEQIAEAKASRYSEAIRYLKTELVN